MKTPSQAAGIRSGIRAVIFAAIILMAAWLSLLSSCGGREKAAGPILPEDYGGWKLTTDEVLDYPIPGHQDHYRIIFINPEGENPAVEGEGEAAGYTYPDGTIVLKEVYPGRNYPAGEDPPMLMGMVKAQGHPDAREGWIWVVKNLDSGEETVFTDRFCVSCHGNANERHPYGDRNPAGAFRDFLFFPYIP